jgi:hypothetical protein
MPTRAEHAAARKRGQARYDEILEAQGGVCAGCRREPYARRFCIDHDHKTLEVRGLLCFMCNYILSARRGMTAVVLRRLAAYLENPPARKLNPPL